MASKILEDLQAAGKLIITDYGWRLPTPQEQRKFYRKHAKTAAVDSTIDTKVILKMFHKNQRADDIFRRVQKIDQAKQTS
jgi:glutamine phosphoribosylpyrophosphate amidotransferase